MAKSVTTNDGPPFERGSIRPFKRVLCANRGEIAIRVFRACSELGFRTVAIFSEEDRVHLHRYKADEAYLVGKGLEPVAAYLAEDEIVELAKRHDVDAIHPGYGLLSERASSPGSAGRPASSSSVRRPRRSRRWETRWRPRKIAVAAGVPTVPGTPDADQTLEAARAFADQAGYPVMIKASAGGGGRGMRVVRSAGELPELLERARSEANKAFGDDSVFLEKLVLRPKHIEVPDPGRQPRQPGAPVRARLLGAAPPPEGRRVRAGLVAPRGRCGRGWPTTRSRSPARSTTPTPARSSSWWARTEALLHRGQPAHPGRAHRDRGDHWSRPGAGAAADRRGLSPGGPGDRHRQPGEIVQRGVAIQVRVTAEDPGTTFSPTPARSRSTARRRAWASASTTARATSGRASRHIYDSLLAKITASGLEWNYARRKVVRALREFRIRGVKTNLAFLENVLLHPTFAAGKAHTTFIDETPALVQYAPRRDRATRILRYVGSTIVNGHPTVRGKPKPPLSVLSPQAAVPPVPKTAPPPGTKQVLDREGPAGIVKMLRADRACA